MQKHHPVSIRELIAFPTNPLQPLLAWARQLEDVHRFLQERLEDPLRRHCQVANIHGDTIVLHTDSSAWSARLRFSAPQILSILQQRHELSGLRHIQVRVVPPALLQVHSSMGVNRHPSSP